MNTPISALLAEKKGGLLTVPLSVSVADAVAVMNRNKVGSVLVMDGDRLAGIFTERDVLYRVVARGRPPAGTPVSEVMTADPKTISPEMTVDETLAFISERRCRHLPVVDDGRIVGLISQGDVTRFLVEAHKAQAEQLMNYFIGGLSS